MKKMYVIATGVMALGFIVTGTIGARAASTPTEQPAWVLADGSVDYNKMPDNADITYGCWNGKTTHLTGKTIKQKMNNHPMPGSAEHNLGIAKSKELAAIPGVVTKGADGAEVVNLDETNPQVVAVMQKYELKETPQCQ